MMGRRFLILGASLCTAMLVPAQQSTTPTRSASAVSALAASLHSMTPSGPIGDMTISASVGRGEGADKVSGNATLLASSIGQAHWTYTIENDQHSEIVNPSTDPQAAWAGADGIWHQSAPHNRWAPAAWFAPALLFQFLLSDSQVALQNVGPTTLDGEAVQHLRCWRVLPTTSGSAASRALIQASSVVDVYIDAATALPVALRFNLHPDSNAGVNIPVDVRFLNWQLSSGTLVPFEIQRSLNGSLLDDISVSSVTMNSGISDSSFNVPMIAGGGQ